MRQVVQLVVVLTFAVAATPALAQDGQETSSSQTSSTTPTGIRVLAESGGGLLGMTAGGAWGGLLGTSIGVIATDGINLTSVGIGVVGSLLGGAAAFPVGTFLAGNATGADGSLGWTYVGGLLGVGTTVATGVALPTSPGKMIMPLPAFIAFEVALPITGAVLGYELSRSKNATRTAEGSSFRLQPLVTTNNNGLESVGLTVQF